MDCANLSADGKKDDFVHQIYTHYTFVCNSSNHSIISLQQSLRSLVCLSSLLSLSCVSVRVKTRRFSSLKTECSFFVSC